MTGPSPTAADCTALFEANLPLVASLCRRLCWHSVDREDLYQQGCIGLLLAARRYDPSLGTAFSTYAVPYIMGEMRACCHAAAAIRLPRSEHAFLNRLRSARDDLMRQTGHDPSLNELAAALHMEPAELAQHTEPAVFLSIDEPRSEDDPAPLLDQLPSDDPWLERLMLHDILDHLTATEYTLYRLRFQQHLTQQQAACAMALSQPQISRLEAALKHRLMELWEG